MRLRATSGRRPPRRPTSLPNSALVHVHHWLSRLAMKGLLKLRHVGNHSIGAIFPRRMGIDGGPQPLALVADMPAPALPIADEETLLWRELIDWIKLLSLGVVFPGHVSEHQSA